MIGYALRRFLGAIPTLFVIITLAFFMMRAAPGGPFDSERRLPPEIEQNLKAAYDLDKPLVQQYLIYLGKAVQGDLGPSFKNKDFTVTQLIGNGLPVSARLGLWSMALALLIGTALGILAALRQNRWQDYSVMSVAMLGITIPTFVTAPLLTLIFGIYGITIFGLEFSLPVGGWNGGAWRNLVLPVTVLALPQIAIIARLMRGAMVEVLRANYIRTARAKGLSGDPHRACARAARGGLAAGELSGTGAGGRADRLAGGGADIRPARHRPLFRAGRAEPRLHVGDGGGDLLRQPDHPAEFPGRHRIRDSRSPGAG